AGQSRTTEARPQATTAKPEPAPASEPPPIHLAMEEPTSQRPVVAGAALQPAQVRPGETVTLVVQVRTAPTWYIYAVENQTAGKATTLKWHWPDGVKPEGDWSNPQPRLGADGQNLIYDGE